MTKIARTVPNVNFPVRIDDDESGFTWGEIDTESIFAGRRILVFSLPGAFTPTCTMNQLPGFEAYFDQLKQYGIDDIYCASVNDTFVMNAWFKESNTVNVKPIGDGEGVFTQGMGMLVNKPKQGFGMRSWRYAMLVDNGEIVKQFVEAGQNNASDDDDPFKVSDAQTMLDFIKSNAG